MDNLKVSDELWARIQPLVPVVQRRHRWPGRRRMDDRACLNGILIVLGTGISWQHLPQQLGYGSGMTCWRRLRDWQIAGVWDRLHQLLLTELRATGQLDLASAIVDSSHVRAVKGGRQPDQAQSTGAAPAPSTMSSPTPPASHWLSSSRAVTATTSPSSFPCWTRSHPSAVALAGHGGNLECWSPTVATTMTSTAGCYAPVGSDR
jgi:transposase